jgi:transposase
MLTNTLQVPTELVGKVPCQDPQTRGLFLTRDLDIDTDDTDYLVLSAAEQQQRHEAKAAAEIAAVEACQMCPIMAACREWALQAHVHGVAGGLTETQRYRVRAGIATGGIDDISRGARNAVPDVLVRAWTEEGTSTEEIAGRLNCSIRTVERARRRTAPNRTARRSASATPLHTRAAKPAAAKNALDFSSLTPESLAMYEFLAEQDQPVSRRDVVRHVAGYVAADTALKWGENLPCAEENKQEQGAMKFVRNRIDIAYRHGRVLRMGKGKETTLSLPASVRGAFAEWRARNAQAALSA